MRSIATFAALAVVTSSKMVFQGDNASVVLDPHAKFHIGDSTTCTHIDGSATCFKQVISLILLMIQLLLKLRLLFCSHVVG